MDDYVKTYTEIQKEKERFFESKDFFKLLDIVKKHKLISEEDLRYHETLKHKGLSHKDFVKLHNCVSWKFEDEFKEIEGVFPEVYYEYKGVTFHIMWGQGSSMWTTTNND